MKALAEAVAIGLTVWALAWCTIKDGEQHLEMWKIEHAPAVKSGGR